MGVGAAVDAVVGAWEGTAVGRMDGALVQPWINKLAISKPSVAVRRGVAVGSVRSQRVAYTESLRMGGIQPGCGCFEQLS